MTIVARSSVLGALFGLTLACAPATPPPPSADVILVNARVYTMAWPDPALDGTPSGRAPHGAAGWTPDATAVALTGGTITIVGSRETVAARQGPATQVIDLGGATLLPGLVDSHAHVLELGATLQAVDLAGVATEAEAVERVAAYAAKVPKGQWITGRGWDEGAWANRYPDWRLLSQKVPDHPVLLYSLHGFAVWANRHALDSAGVTRATAAPVGGEIRTDAKGEPTGIFLNRATTLMVAAVPPPTPAQLESQLLAGLNEMARSGYVAVHEAGVDRATLAGLQALDGQEGAADPRLRDALGARS